MKKSGLYYIKNADKLIYISKVRYFEDLFNPPFSIVTWEQENKVYKKVLIEKRQFKNFTFIGKV